MNIFFMISQQMRLHGRILWLITLLLLSPTTIVFSIEPDVEEEVETLDVIEITGTIVEQDSRDLNFSIPEIQAGPPLNLSEYLPLPKPKLVRFISTHSRIILDQTASTRTLFTPAKPLKMEHPPFPRQAREQGWHGRVIIRLEILPDGTVESGTIQKSSGYQLLDDKAIKAATQWTFDPAKNGGFPVATTVNIPIQFDLIK